MSILTHDIVESIIDILAPDDPKLQSTKACSLVCHEFLTICRKRIFARIILNNPNVDPPPSLRISWVQHGSTTSFKKILSSSPDLADYIRELAINITTLDLNDLALVKAFKKINQLQALTLRCSRSSQSVWDNKSRLIWNKSPLRPGLLHLLHLPTLISFNLLAIENFVVEDLIPCTHLKHIRLADLSIVAASGTLNPLPSSPVELRELSGGAKSAPIFTAMCAMQCTDGSPFFDFRGLNALAFVMSEPADLEGLQIILNRCERLVSLSVRADFKTSNPTFSGLSKMIAPSVPTLKRMDVLLLFDDAKDPEKGQQDPFCGFIDALENMGDNNIVEAISIGVIIQVDSSFGLLEKWARLDQVLASTGWSKLRKVSLTVKTHHWFWDPSNPMDKIIQDFPVTQFSRLSSHNSVVFDFRLVAQPL